MSRKTAFQLLSVSLAAFLFTVGLRMLNGGQSWAYVQSHRGWTVLLPLALIFLGLLARNFYVEYRPEPDETIPGHTRNARV